MIKPDAAVGHLVLCIATLRITALLDVSRCGCLTGEGRGMAGRRMWKAGEELGTGGFGFDVDAQRCYSKSIKKATAALALRFIVVVFISLIGKLIGWGGDYIIAGITIR